jgi:DNA primase
MQKVIDDAQPMVNLLWQRETEARNFDSPERKAALDKTLRTAIARITDPSIRGHYGEEIRRLSRDLFGPKARVFIPRAAWVRGAKGPPQPVAPMAATRASLLAAAGRPVHETLREAVILAACIRHPGLIVRFLSSLERLEFLGEGHDLLRNLILFHSTAPDLLATLMHEAPIPTEAVLLHPHVRITPALSDGADPEIATSCLTEALARLQADRTHRLEILDAEDDLSGVADEGLTWRLSKAAEAIETAARGPQEARAESVTAPNGVEQSRDELNRARRLYDSIDFTAKGRHGRT